MVKFTRISCSSDKAARVLADLLQNEGYDATATQHPVEGAMVMAEKLSSNVAYHFASIADPDSSFKLGYEPR